MNTPNQAVSTSVNPLSVAVIASQSVADETQACNATDNSTNFDELALAKPILQALTQSGYTHPTPIQAQAIPPSIAGRDLLLSAQTGSGKTAAFVLPILNRIAVNNYDAHTVRAVILTPTRELALQVQDNVRKYSSKMKGVFSIPLVGGAPYGGQLRALRKGVQIIVATPGRFIDHLNDGRIDLSNLEVLVLDEADRMLDMGFSDAIDTILKATPAKRQTIMSSATWDGAVGKIAESFTYNPERVSIKVESAHIDESVYFCDDFRHKNDILYEVLNNPEINQAVIFASTKISTEKLANDLVEKGYKARYLHGDLPQGKRNRIVSDVKAGKCQFLVATDVAARGIDIATISHVVNYDLPRQAEDYVHRIGRCGRAGRTGMAINLCSFDDRGQLFAINRYLSRDMRTATVDGLEPKRNFEDRPNRDGKKRRSSSPSGGNHRSESRSFGERSGRSFESGSRYKGEMGYSKDRQDRDKPTDRYKVKSTAYKTEQNKSDKPFKDRQDSIRSFKGGKSQDAKTLKNGKSKFFADKPKSVGRPQRRQPNESIFNQSSKRRFDNK